MLFVDTSVWFASQIAGDPHHEAVTRMLDSVAEPFVTSDYSSKNYWRSEDKMRAVNLATAA